MKTKLSVWLGAVAFGLILAGAFTSVSAADSATGKWKWSSERGGQTSQYTLVLKQDGDKLTGTLTGGRSGSETAITDGAIKNGEVSFTVARERSGQKSVSSYKGKLSGDTIKGTIESERSGQKQSRDWEAKRASE